jgi:hypothetical protein
MSEDVSGERIASILKTEEIEIENKKQALRRTTIEMTWHVPPKRSRICTNIRDVSNQRIVRILGNCSENLKSIIFTAWYAYMRN